MLSKQILIVAHGIDIENSDQGHVRHTLSCNGGHLYAM